MKPEEIGELLGTEPESVVAAREAALEQLATQLDMEDSSQLDEVRARLAELPSEAWTGSAAAAAARPKPKPQLSVVREEPSARRPAERRRSRLPLLLALLAVAAVALVIVLASSGGSDTNTASKPKSAAPAPPPSSTPASKPAKKKQNAPAPAPAARETKLIALAGATGTASLTQGGKRLTIKASGLPAGTYQVWLYDSVIDAVSLTKVQGTGLTVDLKLPANASRYRYVDVSREPDDGNPNHSGESVLRVSLSRLSG
jgi:hypothetical protein